VARKNDWCQEIIKAIVLSQTVKITPRTSTRNLKPERDVYKLEKYDYSRNK